MISGKKCTAIAFLAIFLPLLAEGQQKVAKPMTVEFDKLLSEQFKSNETGCVALVAIKGDIVYRKAFGLANLELGIPMKPEMVFKIGSITKQFTAVAILQLVEQGKLSLQDDITKFIPDYPTQAYRITIENLLTHTSGIKSYTNVAEFQSYAKEDLSPSHAIDKFKNLPMEFAPGTKWSYNNSGYFLLGYIIEKITGGTYREYVEKNLFEPAGMSGSLYGSDSKIIINRASGYEPNGDRTENASYLSMLLPYSAGALMSTVDDLYKWNRALLSGKLLKKETLEKAFTGYKLADGKDTHYGYGWMLRQIKGSSTIEHGGAINGYLTNAIYLPEEDVFVTVFSNCTGKSPDQVSVKMAAIAINKPIAFAPIEVPEATLDNYTGVYETENADNLYIIKEDKKLYYQRNGGSKNEIRSFAADKFFLDDDFTTITFSRNESGIVTEGVIDDRGPLQIFKKTDKPLPLHYEIVVSSEIKLRYTGDYELAPGFIISVTAEGERIYTQATGQGRVEIFPESETRFFLKVVDASLDFVKDDTGKWNRIILHQGGRDMEGKRLVK